MSTLILLGIKGGRPVRKADNFTAICELIVYKMWVPRRLTTLCASTACYRDSFTFYIFTVTKNSRNFHRLLLDFSKASYLSLLTFFLFGL
jgi:hypothetical protein